MKNSKGHWLGRPTETPHPKSIERWTGAEWVPDDGNPGLAFSGLSDGFGGFGTPTTWTSSCSCDWMNGTCPARIAVNRTVKRYSSSIGKDMVRMSPEPPINSIEQTEKESIMANIIASIIEGCVVYGNTDSNEGRGPRVVLAYASSRRIAEEFGKGKGPCGSPADVRSCICLVAQHPCSGELMVPINGGDNIRWVPYLTKNMETLEQEEGYRALEWLDNICQTSQNPILDQVTRWNRMTKEDKDHVLKAYRNR